MREQAIARAPEELTREERQRRAEELSPAAKKRVARKKRKIRWGQR